MNCMPSCLWGLDMPLVALMYDAAMVRIAKCALEGYHNNIGTLYHNNMGLKGSLDSLFQTANMHWFMMLQCLIFEVCFENLFFEIARVRICYAELCESAGAAKEFPPYEPVTELKKVYQGSVKVISDGLNQGLTGLPCAK